MTGKRCRRCKIASEALASLAMIGATLTSLTFASLYPSNGRRPAWLPNDVVDQSAAKAGRSERVVVLTFLSVGAHLPNATESWVATAE
jgi:hypothetical protein